jgi:hypothetical protein
MRASLAAAHWQTRSLAPHVVADETASEMQVVAQLGITACERPARARRATAVNEYCMLTVGGLTSLPLNE